MLHYASPRVASFILGAALLGGALPAAAEDWPQWRGPGRDGIAADLPLPRDWPEQLTKVWQTEVGEGHSSPVTAAGAVYQFSRQDDREIIRRLNGKEGTEVWRQAYPAPYEINSAARDHGPGPKSTPAVADGKLFSLGISGILSCWDAASGEPVWQHEFSDQYPRTSPLFGAAASPLVVDGLCIVHVGGHDEGALTAFDVDSGRLRWRLEAGPAYASPLLVTLSRVRQIVTQTQTACIGVSLAGKLLWEIPFTTGYDQNSITPVLADEMLVFGGFERATIGVRLVKRGRTLPPQESWFAEDVPLYMSTPVLHQGKLWGLTQRNSGQLFRLDPQTGAVEWTGAGRAAENASLISAGGRLLVSTTGGELLVLRPADGEPQEVARYQVAESPVWAHPAPLGAGLLVKDFDTLTLWSWDE